MDELHNGFPVILVISLPCVYIHAIHWLGANFRQWVTIHSVLHLCMMQAELHTVAAERDRLGAELSQAAEEIEERTKRETEAQGISTSAQEAEQVARVQLQAAQEALLSEQCRAEAAEAECKAAREQQEVVESQMEALQVPSCPLDTLHQRCNTRFHSRCDFTINTACVTLKYSLDMCPSWCLEHLVTGRRVLSFMSPQ